MILTRLSKAVARARSWFEALTAGAAKSMADIVAHGELPPAQVELCQLRPPIIPLTALSRLRPGEERQASISVKGNLAGPFDSAGISHADHSMSLEYPSLAPLVVLHIAERSAFAASNAKIELGDVGILAERLGLAIEPRRSFSLRNLTSATYPGSPLSRH
jgi:hypothetical protein